MTIDSLHILDIANKDSMFVTIKVDTLVVKDKGREFPFDDYSNIELLLLLAFILIWIFSK
jgi:hypothetical protein